jgi:2-oxoglutarate dehydrogenase E2 component (dihydrolipoamide succinyltransferase)
MAASAPAPKAAAAPAPKAAAVPVAAPVAAPAKAPVAPVAAAQKAAAPASSSSSTPLVVTPPGARTETRVKMTRMRMRISQRLKESQNTAAMLTTFQECDMSSVFDLREKYKDAFEKKHGVKLGFMSAFVKAAASSLQEMPIINAVIEGGDIVYRDYVDISVAVSSPRGLVVPVIRNCETMNFAGIEKTLGDLALKARNDQIAVEDMAGGTFTISNGGTFGSLMGTPIINPPQSAILGMHATKMRPVVVGGKVEVRPIMYLALTYDHRLIDGREAVLFLCSVRDKVEDARRLLLGL